MSTTTPTTHRGIGVPRVAFPELGAFSDFFEPDAACDDAFKKRTPVARRAWCMTTGREMRHDAEGSKISTYVSVRGPAASRGFYASPRESLRDWVRANMLDLGYDEIHFEVVVRDDGSALLTASYSRICGNRWLAYLDPATVPDPAAALRAELPAAARPGRAGDRRVDDDVRRVLAAASIEGNRLRLTAGLDKALFLRVKKLLGALGGPWQGGRTQAFVFGHDPTDEIEAAVLTGYFTDAKVEYQAFDSPAAVADHLADLAELWRLPAGARVYEPSAGRGAVARALRARLPEGVLLLVNDIDPGKRELLRAEGFTLHGDTVGGDFLQQSFDVGFDVIVQNPPFWKRMDARHILWAYECLRRGGRLVSVAGANLRWRGDSEYEQVRRLVAERGGTIEDLPEGSFRESGTDVSAVVVVVDK